jgi:hypothetical protein
MVSRPWPGRVSSGLIFLVTFRASSGCAYEPPPPAPAHRTINHPGASTHDSTCHPMNKAQPPHTAKPLLQRLFLGEKKKDFSNISLRRRTSPASASRVAAAATAARGPVLAPAAEAAIAGPPAAPVGLASRTKHRLPPEAATATPSRSSVRRFRTWASYREGKVLVPRL